MEDVIAKGGRKRVRVARTPRAVKAAGTVQATFGTAAVCIGRVDLLGESPGAGAGKHGSGKQTARLCLVSGRFTVTETSPVADFLQVG